MWFLIEFDIFRLPPVHMRSQLYSCKIKFLLRSTFTPLVISEYSLFRFIFIRGSVNALETPSQTMSLIVSLVFVGENNNAYLLDWIVTISFQIQLKSFVIFYYKNDGKLLLYWSSQRTRHFEAVIILHFTSTQSTVHST